MMMIIGGLIIPRLAQLCVDFAAVRDQDAHPLAGLPDVGAEAVLEMLDADPLDDLHGRIVATCSYLVNSRGQDNRIESSESR
jgi:hypothetical protein